MDRRVYLFNLLLLLRVQIPADMVVNAMLVAMVAHANVGDDNIIYHVGSSVRNPIRYCNLRDYAFRYFKSKPLRNKEGKIVKVGNVTVLNSMDSFRTYMSIRYMLLLKVSIYLFIIHYQLSYN